MLEIGPGHDPFPTAAGARVTYADRSAPGGRDATWPELSAFPHGPDADLDIDLDVDRLAGVADASFDAVIASHLIEHLANPLAALQEFERVLRPGGRLVLVVPDRTRTFDSVREPTPLAHLIDEFDRQVTEVDAEHIKEFCEAIYRQPPFHPEEVRAWHDPSRLDDERLDLHRRRSIHAHCWTPEEFAVLVVGGMARGLMRWRLTDLYFSDDIDGPEAIEFGLVLERPRAPEPAGDLRDAFLRDWVALALRDRSPHRVVALHAAVLRDFEGGEELAAAAHVVTETLSTAMAETNASAASLRDQLEASQQQLALVVRGRSYRTARVLGTPVRLVRRLRGRA